GEPARKLREENRRVREVEPRFLRVGAVVERGGQDLRGPWDRWAQLDLLERRCVVGDVEVADVSELAEECHRVRRESPTRRSLGVDHSSVHDERGPARNVRHPRERTPTLAPLHAPLSGSILLPPTAASPGRGSSGTIRAMAATSERTAESRLEEVMAAGAKRLRIQFTDLLGVPRNKVVPLSTLDDVLERGINFCIATFAVDHAGEVIEGTGLGAEVDFRDGQVVPDLSTLTVLPWETETAVVIGDIHFEGEPLPASPRQLLKRAIDEMGTRGYRSVAGHELEFFLLRENGNGYEQYAKQPGLVYMLSPSVDTEVVLREMEDAVGAMGLPVEQSHQEYFGSQWEITLRYDDAL